MIFNRPRRIAKKTPLSNLAVGDSVFVNVGGVKTEFFVVHQGRPSSLYDISCNGTWLLMKDVYETRKWHNSAINKYESSDIHVYLNATFLGLFDSGIRNIIKQVKIPYHKNGGPNGNDQSGANGLSCKVFLLSGYEVGYTTNDSTYLPQDGAKLDFFILGDAGGTKRIAYLNGSATSWWLRSPNFSNGFRVWYIYANRGVMDYLNAIGSSGVRPALILPSDAKVDADHNIIG